MALALAVKENDGVIIGDHHVRITAILYDNQAVITLDNKDSFILYKDVWVEILPQVRVTRGESMPAKSMKFLLEAPRSILILREKLDDKV